MLSEECWPRHLGECTRFSFTSSTKEVVYINPREQTEFLVQYFNLKFFSSTSPMNVQHSISVDLEMLAYISIPGVNMLIMKKTTESNKFLNI